MNEIKDILKAYQTALKQGKKAALATVVHVEGSSYRRPGARMLVTEDGMLTGAISGGCLEGDALRKALLAINENKNKLVTYDTTDEDDARFGVQLGCNGIVHILFEPLQAQDINNPIELLKKTTEKRHPAVIVVIFSLHTHIHQPGTCISITKEGSTTNNQAWSEGKIIATIETDGTTALMEQSTVIKNYKTEKGEITALMEVIQPAVSLVVCGAGNDAIPLVTAGKLTGWETTVIDGRKTHATMQRFADTKIIVTRAETALNDIIIDERTVFVLMTHNYNYDLEVLRQLSQTDCKYIGILGPRKKLERMLEELAAAGTNISTEQLLKIYGPVGLDIGAETAEEIALSIAAEIKAVLSGNNGQFLRDKREAIHSRNEKTSIYK